MTSQPDEVVKRTAAQANASSDADTSSSLIAAVGRLVDAAREDSFARTNRDGRELQSFLEILAILDPPGAEAVSAMSAGHDVRLVDGSDFADSSTAEPIGATDFLERFEFQSKVSHGGFSYVVKAHDRTAGRDVAIKFPRLDVLLDKSLVDRFCREPRMLAALDHPNIVPVYEAGRIGPLPYFVMAYCLGPTLSDWRASQAAAVPPRVAAAIVLQLAAGVDYAHRRGLLHRDIKPSNVLLFPFDANQTGEFPFAPKLTDFGLAREIARPGTVTGHGVLVGTLGYMSPEQADGRTKDISVQSDVYSLGAMLFELLAGRTPFIGESPAEVLRAISEEPAPRLRHLRSDVSRDLEAICSCCLEKAPDRRYASAAELRDDIRRFLQNEPVRARPIGAVVRVARWCRRKPAVAGLAGAVFISAVAGIIGITYQWRQSTWHAQIAERQAEVAKNQKRIAEKHLAESQQSLLDMAWMFQESSPFLAGEPHILHELHARLAVYYSKLSQGNASPELRLPILAACSSFETLTYFQDSAVHAVDHGRDFRKAADLWWDVVRKWPQRPTYRRALTLHLLTMAEYYRRAGKNEEAAKCRSEAEKALSPPWSGTDSDAPAFVDMAKRLDDLAGTLRGINRVDDAICLKRASASLLAHVRVILPNDSQVLVQWAAAQCRVAAEAEQKREGETAGEILASVEGELSSALDWRMPTLEIGLSLADVLRRRATIAKEQRNLRESREIFDGAVRLLDRLEAVHGGNAPSLRRVQAPVIRGLAYVERSLGEKERAWDTFSRCRMIFRELHADRDLTVDEQMQFGRLCANAGSVAIDLGRHEDAAAAFAEAIEVFGRVDGQARFVISDLQGFAESATMLGRIREGAGEHELAKSLYEQALPLWHRLNKRSPRTPAFQQRLAWVEQKLAQLSSDVTAPQGANLGKMSDNIPANAADADVQADEADADTRTLDPCDEPQ